MIATAFDEDNIILNMPPGLEGDPLSAYQGKDKSDNDVVISCWKLSKEEVDELLKTGRIWLIVLGQGMPPVHLTGRNPFHDQT